MRVNIGKIAGKFLIKIKSENFKERNKIVTICQGKIIKRFVN